MASWTGHFAVNSPLYSCFTNLTHQENVYQIVNKRLFETFNDRVACVCYKAHNSRNLYFNSSSLVFIFQFFFLGIYISILLPWYLYFNSSSLAFIFQFFFLGIYILILLPWYLYFNYSSLAFIFQFKKYFQVLFGFP